jgi:hypothetical protein
MPNLRRASCVGDKDLACLLKKILQERFEAECCSFALT